MAGIVETLQSSDNHIAANFGPGEVLSELALGCRKAVRQGKLTATKAQEFFDLHSRAIMIIAVANPDIPWDTGSTEVRELIEAEGKTMYSKV